MPQTRLHIVGIEHGVLGRLCEAISAMAQHVGERADIHAHLAVERGDAAEVGVGRVLDELGTTLPLADERHRRERSKCFRQHNRTGAGTAAAMGRREGLVEVDVHGVDAEVARAHDAHDGVEVGAVAVEIGARLVHRLRDVDDLRFEQAARVGVGQHDRRHVGTERSLDRGGIDSAVVTRGDGFHGIAEECGGRRVGTMRGFGDENDVPVLLSLRLLRGADCHHAGHLAVRVGLGREADGRGVGEVISQ